MSATTATYTLGTLADMGCEMQLLTVVPKILKAYATGIDGRKCAGCKRKMTATLHVGDGNSFNPARATMAMVPHTRRNLCDDCDPAVKERREGWERTRVRVNPHDELGARVRAWFASGDTGLSSVALVHFLTDGVQPADWRGRQYPLDPDDLGRCVRALDALPELRERLNNARALSPEWAALIEHWDEIEALYREEFPTGMARRCYARMKALIDSVKAATA